MKRIVLLVTVAVLMALTLAVTGGPASAQPDPQTLLLEQQRQQQIQQQIEQWRQLQQQVGENNTTPADCDMTSGWDIGIGVGNQACAPIQAPIDVSGNSLVNFGKIRIS